MKREPMERTMSAGHWMDGEIVGSGCIGCRYGDRWEWKWAEGGHVGLSTGVDLDAEARGNLRRDHPLLYFWYIGGLSLALYFAVRLAESRVLSSRAVWLIGEVKARWLMALALVRCVLITENLVEKPLNGKTGTFTKENMKAIWMLLQTGQRPKMLSREIGDTSTLSTSTSMNSLRTIHALVRSLVVS